MFLLWYCLVKHFHNIIQFLLKISFIWWDKFICNFKYIFINEQVFFLKNNCNSYGKLTKSRVLRGGVGALRGLRGGDDTINFSHHARRDGDRVRQNHEGRERRPHPSDLPRPIAIPSCHWHPLPLLPSHHRPKVSPSLHLNPPSCGSLSQTLLSLPSLDIILALPLLMLLEGR